LLCNQYCYNNPVAAAAQERRRYDASGRRQRAEATRAAVIAEAARLFVEHGYVHTSIGGIAEAAGVSSRTVFGAFGSKAHLLKHVIDAAVVGDIDPVPLHQRPQLRRFHESATFDDACDRLGEVFEAVAPRTHAIYRVVDRAADSDQDIRALKSDLDRQRLTGTGLMADTFARLLGVSDDDGWTRVRDILWLLGSPQQYGLLVEDRGWSPAAYRAWTVQALRQLLPTRVSGG